MCIRDRQGPAQHLPQVPRGQPGGEEEAGRPLRLLPHGGLRGPDAASAGVRRLPGAGAGQGEQEDGDGRLQTLPELPGAHREERGLQPHVLRQVSHTLGLEHLEDHEHGILIAIGIARPDIEKSLNLCTSCLKALGVEAHNFIN